MNPTRYTLLSIYTEIHDKLTGQGIRPKEIIEEKSRTLRLDQVSENIFRDTLKDFRMEELVYLRALNDQQRYFLGDDLMQVALVLNELLPRFKDLEVKEKQNYAEVEKLSVGNVISAGDLTYKHLVNETPGYLRRLITSAVEPSGYYMHTGLLHRKDIEEMEMISANWVLTGNKIDEEALKILSLLGVDGKPTELKDTDVARFKYIRELSPALMLLSNFKRSDSALFSRFIILLPSALAWTIGKSSSLSTEECDAVMDLLETTMTFTRALQSNADQATRVRQMLHHGFPVYKDLMELAKLQSNLMSWNFEGIIYRLSQNLSIILKNRENEPHVTRFLMASGVLPAYARHKEAYVKR